MKKLTKATALILSTIMLFGCASNSAKGNVGDTTPPSESTADESSIAENSSASDTSEEKQEENLIQNIEGYQTFSYDPEKHIMLNKEEYTASFMGFYEGSDIGYVGPTPFDPTPENFKEYYSDKFEPVAVKCRVVGDSYVFTHGMCGEVKVLDPIRGSYLLYTPVIIEKIIDTYGSECGFKEGDIVYVEDSYSVTDQYNEYSLKWAREQLSFIKDHFEDEEGNYNGSSEDYLYYSKMLEFYDMILNGNGKYILNSSAPVIIQKGQSYLMFLNNDNTPNEVDGNIYNKMYDIAFDLENDEPTVYKSKEEDEIIFYWGKVYPPQWKYLKEKYGEYFEK